MQQKRKTRPDLVEKVIHKELCTWQKLDSTSKYYMHKLGSFLENDTQKFSVIFYKNGSPNTTRKSDQDIIQRQ